MSPNDPLPIFLPSRYFPPTRSSMLEITESKETVKIKTKNKSTFSWDEERKRSLEDGMIDVAGF